MLIMSILARFISSRTLLSPAMSASTVSLMDSSFSYLWGGGGGQDRQVFDDGEVAGVVVGDVNFVLAELSDLLVAGQTVVQVCMVAFSLAPTWRSRPSVRLKPPEPLPLDGAFSCDSYLRSLEICTGRVWLCDNLFQSTERYVNP
ncbi:hypothetical protein F7725_016056 [Dissostichus mawsoni]|uniref:Secreted protein n=1 Tax=Dissostichus mawsoni TaxID=36200 RepID=A0A7J5Y6P6_DISMA|nr:hypothetical protein F7725_016056 [Dissostichus mawsoni]